ncbi:cytochrome P450 [Pholiota molesta]|nr:cytochrome P450 [Pholiota molesta]
MDKHQVSDTSYQAKVLRTDVNRSIPTYIPEILDESVLAMSETFKPNEKQTVSIPVFDTMTHFIARISNRVIFGEELCRNEKFLNAVVRFSEMVPVMAPFIQWSPLILRPIVYFFLASVLGGKKEPLKYLVPHLKQYMKDRENMVEKPQLVSEFIIKNALPKEPIEGIAVRLLNINFASIHTSAIFITQALFEIAMLSPEDIESMRTEIKQVLEKEGGWTKDAIDKMYKVDSALREVGRYYGLVHSTLSRVATLGCDLGDGTHVPPGFRVAVDIRAIHFDPDVYEDPDRCDLFRFSKMRAKDGADSKYGFAMVDSNYLPFGAGRHACAGRFFAAMELKIMLAHILLEYDFGYQPGITQRPKNLIFNGAIIPDPKTHLLFKARSNKTL